MSLNQCRSCTIVKDGPGGSGTHDLSNILLGLSASNLRWELGKSDLCTVQIPPAPLFFFLHIPQSRTVKLSFEKNPAKAENRAQGYQNIILSLKTSFYPAYSRYYKWFQFSFFLHCKRNPK
jgi:hypothetical protein